MRQAERMVRNTRSTFASTLRGGYDDEKAWKAVARLRVNATRLTFDTCVQWLQATDPRKRERAAAILGQLRTKSTRTRKARHTTGDVYRVQESLDLLLDVLAREHIESVLNGIVAALGYLGRVEAIPFLLPFAASPKVDVRYQATHALGQFSTDPEALSALLLLMRDEDKEIRDWSTFFVGQFSKSDSSEVSAALAANLTDTFREVRVEAVAGLAKRKDHRALAPLIRLIQHYGVWYSTGEAAEDLLGLTETPADWTKPDYLRALRQLQAATL